MARRSYRGNSVATVLSTGISAVDTTATVTDGSGLPVGTNPFVITVNINKTGEEKILVSGRSGNTLSGLTRGYDGTTAATHQPGESVIHTLSAVDLDEANAHVNAATGVHGLTGAMVGTTDAQTLTNKTLTQAQTHYSPDTDAATTSLHHTLGGGANQAAAGNHTHASSTGLGAAAAVATSETTSSGTYAALTTAGPAVTFTVPASGSVLVTLTAAISGALGGMSLALSGANTLAAADARSLSPTATPSGSGIGALSAQVLLTGLTPGSTTFTASYRTTGGSSTFAGRVLSVLPL